VVSFGPRGCKTTVEASLFNAVLGGMNSGNEGFSFARDIGCLLTFLRLVIRLCCVQAHLNRGSARNDTPFALLVPNLPMRNRNVIYHINYRKKVDVHNISRGAVMNAHAVSMIAKQSNMT
jgi:hypothetical protein